MRFTADCAEIMQAHSRPPGLLHYRYAKRSVLDGKEQIVGVDEAGRQFPLGPPAADLSEYEEWEPDDEEVWDLCGRDVGTSYCHDCDNEVCPQCREGCTCEERDEERGYNWGVADEG